MEAGPSDFWLKASTPEGKLIGAINYKDPFTLVGGGFAE
jgi:hypothetical protein